MTKNAREKRLCRMYVLIKQKEIINHVYHKFTHAQELININEDELIYNWVSFGHDDVSVTETGIEHLDTNFSLSGWLYLYLFHLAFFSHSPTYRRYPYIIKDNIFISFVHYIHLLSN